MASKKKQKHNYSHGLIIFLGLILVVVLFAYGSKLGRNLPLSLPTNTGPTPISSESLVTGTPISKDTYAGVLPCADCSGLLTKITFSRDQAYQAFGTYVMEETYEGKSDTPYITKGEWHQERGIPSDPYASLYVLTQADGGQDSYYLQVNPTTIEMLGSNRSKIDSPFNMTLTKQPTTQIANPASVNCVEKGGKSEIRTDADGNQYGMCIMSDGRECDEWTFFREGTCAAY